MDDLISILSHFSVNETTFEDQLDLLITKMEKSEINEDDFEWKRLSKNYAKLNYLLKLIHKHNPDHPKFFKCLDSYLSDLDKVHQRYLEEINWEDEEHYDDAVEIKYFFEESLNQNDSIKKLQLISEAYCMLIQIFEEINKETVSLEVDLEFKQQFKKRKRN